MTAPVTPETLTDEMIREFALQLPPGDSYHHEIWVFFTSRRIDGVADRVCADVICDAINARREGK